MNPLLSAKTSVHRKILRIRTERAPQFLDITPEVRRFVAESGVQEGMVLVFSCHTTAAICINENEPLLLRDMEEFLKRLAPRELYYCHNDFGIRTHNMTPEECPNAHAHLQHLLLGASEAVPVVGGELWLGQWQRIFLVELDRPRKREVLLQVVGYA